MKNQEYEKLESKIAVVQLRFNILVAVFAILIIANFGFCNIDLVKTTLHQKLLMFHRSQ
jgi:hypothetical protein